MAHSTATLAEFSEALNEELNVNRFSATTCAGLPSVSTKPGGTNREKSCFLTDRRPDPCGNLAWSVLAQIRLELDPIWP
jgi:hypothetical protein